MHILQLTKKIPFPPNDGEAIAILQITHGLLEQGHSVTMLSMETGRHRMPANKDLQENNRIDFHSVFVHTDVEILPAVLNLFKNVPYHAERFHSSSFSEKLIAILQHNHFDIIQTEGLFLLSYLSVIRKYTSAPVVYRSHNIEGNIWLRISKTKNNLLSQTYLRVQAQKLFRYERKMIHNVNGIVPISTADTLFYKHAVPEVKIKYIPCAIAVSEKNTNDIPVAFHTMYFIGGLDWIPNQQAVQWFSRDIFPLILEKYPVAEFHIAGRNAPAWFRPEGKNIFFHSEVPDAASFIADKFIAVVPLLAGSGMKIKVAEALAGGKPVVTTSIGAEGMPENMERFLSVADDKNAFAQKVKELLGNPSRAIASAAAGQEFIRTHLNNAVLTKELTGFYQSLLK